MSLCIIPNCNFGGNGGDDRFCRNCGAPLLLKERYRPLQILGQGGFGRTFLAIDTHRPSQQRCVVKQLSAEASVNDKALAMFHREAARLEELGEHPQIPHLLAHFTQGNEHYLVQEYVEGQDLSREVRQAGAFSEEKIWQVLEEMATVLQFVHRRNIIHRDIKPSNIMRRQADGKLMLIDFGVAKLLSQTALQRTMTVIGSPEYMAPEQTRGHIVPASDLYSLGVTCLYLLTLKPPLSFYSPAQDCWFWKEALPPEQAVSDRLAATLDRLLQTPVGKRFTSARALVFHTSMHKTPPALQARLPSQEQAQRNVAQQTEWGRYLTEVDYGPLKQLLEKQKWEAADRMTWQCLNEALQQTGRRRSGLYLSLSDLGKLPCGDLEYVDVLWRKYSRNRFGFSVQAKIYTELGDYGRFCEAVGWRRTYQGYSNVYSLDAPRGHLPSSQGVRSNNWWTYPKRLSERLASCKISSD